MGGFLAITSQEFLVNFVFQLDHFVPKSFAHFLYNIIMVVAKWERDLWWLSLVCENVKWEQFWPFLITIMDNNDKNSSQMKQILWVWPRTVTSLHTKYSWLDSPGKGKRLTCSIVSSTDCFLARSCLVCTLFCYITLRSMTQRHKIDLKLAEFEIYSSKAFKGGITSPYWTTRTTKPWVFTIKYIIRWLRSCIICRLWCDVEMEVVAGHRQTTWR